MFFSLSVVCSKPCVPGTLQEDSAYIYDSVTPYLKVILVTANKDTSRMVLVKTFECITMITMAVGNLAILDYVEKVSTVYIFPSLVAGVIQMLTMFPGAVN